MTAVVYPREAVCSSCGTPIILTWYNPFNLSQGGDAVYRHPANGCEFAGKILKPTGMFAGVIEEDND